MYREKIHVICFQHAIYTLFPVYLYRHAPLKKIKLHASLIKCVLRWPYLASFFMFTKIFIHIEMCKLFIWEFNLNGLNVKLLKNVCVKILDRFIGFLLFYIKMEWILAFRNWCLYCTKSLLSVCEESSWMHFVNKSVWG